MSFTKDRSQLDGVDQGKEIGERSSLGSVEIDDVPNHFRWTSLIVSGRYEEFPDEPEYRTERDHAQMLLEKRFLWWQTAYAAMQLRSKKERHPPLFYCIHIEDMTDRKAVPDSVEARVGFEHDPRAK